MPFCISTLSGEQIRAARALARIDQSELAGSCGLSLETIKRLERIRGPVAANTRTLRAIVEAFSTMGVAFESSEDGGVGVRLSRRETSGQAANLRRASGTIGRTLERSDDRSCHRLIYYSTVNPENAVPLHELLDQVQVAGAHRKAVLEVTGILFAYDGRFVGVLEGPRDNVRQVYGAISCDQRHAGLSIISDQKASARQFRDWSVCCGLFPSDMDAIGDEPALREGFRPEGLSPASALGLISVMRDLTEESPRRNLHSRTPCPLAGLCLDRTCASRAGGREHTEVSGGDRDSPRPGAPEQALNQAGSAE